MFFTVVVLPQLGLPVRATYLIFELEESSAMSVANSDKNLFRLTLPQRQIVAAHFDFHRVTHRREADEFDFGADEQAHFHEAWAVGGWEIDFFDGSRCAQGDQGQRLEGGRHGLT